METNINVEATILLNYLFDNINPVFEKIVIDKKEYQLKEVDKKEIKIKFNDIEAELGYKVIDISFIITENAKESLQCEIMQGINYGILFPLIGSVRDIIFPEKKNYKINIGFYQDKKEFNIENNRLLLINFSPSFILYIDEFLVSSQLSYISAHKSAQIYCADLEKRLFFSRQISPINYNKFFEMYDNYNDDSEKFLRNIQNMLDSNLFSYELYKTYFKKTELGDILDIKLNFPKNILKNKYNKKEYFEFVSSCCLYCILSQINEEKEIKSIYKYFNDFKKKLENDSSLEYYMKNMIMLEFSCIMVLKGNLEKFKSINFKYYNIKDAAKNSPLYNTNQFLKTFIDKLDDTSPFFYPLSLIDSGNFYYNNEYIYGLGLINKNILKSHLINILPDILIVINDEEENEDQAIANKALGSTVINLASQFLSPLKNVEINKELKDQKFSDKITLILFIEFFHEIFGHKKGGYSQKSNKILSSPNVFYDKQKRSILKLVNKDSPFVNEGEINILRNCEHDAGHFLEYFIGECEYGFYSELIEIMINANVNLNFILNNELWDKKIEIMRKYIKLKYILFIHNKNLLDIKKYENINEEITDLEKIIKENNIKLDIVQETQNPNKEVKLKQSKRKDLFLSDKEKQYEIEKYEKMSFEEIKKIMHNEKAPQELRILLRKILLKRIRRK